jgi:hypothetical protein
MKQVLKISINSVYLKNICFLFIFERMKELGIKIIIIKIKNEFAKNCFGCINIVFC